jgi:hypothetical protein
MNAHDYLEWRNKQYDEYEARGVITQRLYNKLHKLCPLCSNHSVGRTFAGPIAILGENYEDKINDAWCRCGWKGKVNDLIAEK